ncbi:hypothetical protein PHABIO_82 [Pseudomonas phage Phabio]|uniref:Uncharacterized protein n=1 Tax=Pseudomonas phage Phabio TaxID=2006668 RepID=A0A1Y0SY91_9CAUD|nr:nuclear shell protein [Pseudomonas phage Phabio]ARV76713.1 hypothetical protein PHABIO_82 [Pseudomonas phage Phabio]
MIRDLDSNTASQQQAPAPKAQQVQQPTQGQPKMQQQQSQQAGIGSLNSLFQRSGRTEGGDARSAEALQILNRLKEEAVATQDLQNDFTILRFDRDQNQVGWSSLLVVKKQVIGGEPVLAVRPLLMPNAAIQLPVRKVQVSQGMHVETVDVEVDVQSVFSQKYWNRVVDYVKSQLGLPSAKVVLTSAYPIPADFSLKEELILKAVLVKSVNACDDMLQRHSGEEAFSVALLKGSDEYLTAKIDTREQPVLDVLGNPIRSDAVISLARTRKNGNQENEFYEADTQLNQTSVAIDVEYNGQPAQQQNMFGIQQQQFQPPFTATVTVTDVRNAPWIKANTPEMYLLGLSNAFRVTGGSAWAKGFLPRVGVAKDLRDPGALGWLSKLAAKIDTKTDKFKDEHFIELINTMIQPHPVFQIDLDRMSENGAIEGMLIDAAGGPNQQRATAFIIKSINNLIGGGFEKYFDHTTQALLSLTGQEIQKGFYQDSEGEKRDKRDLGTLGALNSSEGNLQEWMNWYGSQLNGNIHPALRAKQSRNYDKQYLGASVTYTGTTAVRAVLNPKLVEALDAALTAAGLLVAMDNIGNLAGGQRFQGNQSIQNFAVSGSAHVVNTMQTGNGFQNTFGQQGPGSFY